METRNLVVAHGREVNSTNESRYYDLPEACGLSDVFFMMDLSPRMFLKRKFWSYPRNRRYLFLVEPKSVYPHQYWSFWSLFFVKRFTRYDQNRWDPGYVSSSDLAEFPQMWGGTRESNPGCVISNKVQSTPGNNYYLRRRVFKNLSESGASLKLAGRGWSEEDSALTLIKQILWSLSGLRFPTRSNLSDMIRLFRRMPFAFFGREVRSARDFLSEHEIAIVIENEDNSYCSEKLSDAIMAGCKILYVGGDLHPLFEETYPLVRLASLGQLSWSLSELSRMEQPVSSNSRQVEAGLAQLQLMSIEKMKTRTKELIEAQSSPFSHLP